MLEHGYPTDGLIILMLSLAFGYFSILFSRKNAPRWKLTDSPGGRKTHDGNIPLVGGIGIYSTLVVMVTLALNWSDVATQITFWAGIIFLAGVIDDRFSISWTWRLLAQIAASAGVIWSTGLSVISLGNYPFIGEIHLGAFSVPFTLFAVVGLTNAFNLVDGIDGLCGSIAIIALAGVMLLGGGSGAMGLYLATFILAVAMNLLFNLQSGAGKKIFLGDAGSQTIGFIISWILIALAQDKGSLIGPCMVLWLVPVPVIETCNTVFRRIRKGQHVFSPDRNHFHHQFIAMGWSGSGVLLIFIMFSVIGLGFGLWIHSLGETVSLAAFLLFSLLSVHIAGKARPPWQRRRRT